MSLISERDFLSVWSRTSKRVHDFIWGVLIKKAERQNELKASKLSKIVRLNRRNHISDAPNDRENEENYRKNFDSMKNI